jgi:hypothetical protein
MDNETEIGDLRARLALAKTLAKEATKADKELRKSKKRRDKDVTNVFASTYKINRGAAEQMRPSGEKIEPQETSKQEFKNSST